MTTVACLGLNCARARQCRLHETHMEEITRRVDRICKIGTTEDFEPMAQWRAVGEWEGSPLPPKHLASVFLLAEAI